MSPATVSRVLNGNAGVRQPARQAVERAIAELNFSPNPSARRLKQGKTSTIVAIVPFFTRPSFVERLRGVLAVLETTNYDLIVYNVESEQRRRYCLTEVPRPERADGVVVVSMSPTDDDWHHLTRYGLPVVLVDAYHPQLPSVQEDAREGGRRATEHLIALGHRRIGFIGGPLQDVFNFTNTSTSYRLKGFRAAIDAAGLTVAEDLIAIDPRAIGEESRERAREETLRWMARSDRPTAVFAASDTQAMGVLQAAQELGLAVPGDLSVIGYDDIELARFLQLTTVRQHLTESGRRGAQLLLDMLERGHAPPMLERIPNEVAARGTTGAPRAEAMRNI